MMTCEHVLHGCEPVPLGSYLKALGVFRLVAEQSDPDARGFWRDERFVLKTRLTEEKLVRFFVEQLCNSGHG
jgi:CRISPR-associated protein Csx17